MKSYYVIRRQSAGCDYTIGCGISVEQINAKNMEEAIEQAIELPADWEARALKAINDGKNCADWINDNLICGSLLGNKSAWEHKLKSVIIVEVTGKEVEVLPMVDKKYDEVMAFQKAHEVKAEEKEERKLLEKLKRKYEK